MATTNKHFVAKYGLATGSFTQTEIDALTPVDGLTVYNSTTGRYQYYSSSTAANMNILSGSHVNICEQRIK